jgi:hypothetical protein
MSVDSLLNDTLNLLTTKTQSCANNFQNNQSIVISCDEHFLEKLADDPELKPYLPATSQLCSGKVTISGVDMSQYAKVDTSCVSQMSADSNLIQKIKQNALDTANKIVASLPVDKQTDDNKSNIINACTNVAQLITQNFSQNCATSVINKQTIVVQNHLQGDIGITGINMNQGITAIAQCTMQSTDVANAIQQLTQLIAASTPSDGGGGGGGGGGGSTSSSIVDALKKYGAFVGCGLLVLMILLVSKFSSYGLLASLLLFAITGAATEAAHVWPYDSANPNNQNMIILITSAVVGGLSLMLMIALYALGRKKPVSNSPTNSQT